MKSCGDRFEYSSLKNDKMRKWLLLAAFGLLMQPASATTVTKKIDVPEFTGIVARSVYDVTLIR